MLWLIENKYNDGRVTKQLHSSKEPAMVEPKKNGIVGSKVVRFKYEIDYYIAPTIYTSHRDGKKYIVPMWMEVHPKTTFEDIKWIKPVTREKKVVNEVKGSMGTYTTTYDPNKKTYKCTCMGFWRSRGNCKHVKALKEKQ